MRRHLPAKYISFLIAIGAIAFLHCGGAAAQDLTGPVPPPKPVQAQPAQPAVATSAKPAQAQSATPAQASPVTPAPAAEAAVPAKPARLEVPTGTKLPLILHNAITTRNAHPGDPLYLETLFPIVLNNKILIPAGSYVQGEIVDAKRPGKVKGRGEMQIKLNTMILPNGYTVNFNAVPTNAGTGGDESVDKEGKIQGDTDKTTDAGTDHQRHRDRRGHRRNRHTHRHRRGHRRGSRAPRRLAGRFAHARSRTGIAARHHL